MEQEDRQFLLTAVWLFMRHGRSARALAVCEALLEDDPRDGTAAAAAASLLLDGGQAERALEILRGASFPQELLYSEAVLETRALRMLGRESEAAARWNRYLEARKGSARRWIA